METENVERGGAAARQNPEVEGRNEPAAGQNAEAAAAKQNPQGDSVKDATEGTGAGRGKEGMIMHIRTDVGKVYDNATLQRLYMAIMDGLITAIVPTIVDECRKIADGLDNSTREVAKEAMRMERGEA